MKYSFGSGYKEIRFHQNRKSKLLSMIKNNPCKIHMYRESEIYDNILRIELWIFIYLNITRE